MTEKIKKHHHTEHIMACFDIVSAAHDVSNALPSSISIMLTNRRV
jgi:hypothetical protein